LYWGEIDLEGMIKDDIFVAMRINGTKYEPIEQLPSMALPVSVFVSKYGRRYNVRSSAYAHVKYDRHYIGYKNKSGELLHTEHPGYDIVDFHGQCYVINYQ
jgi:hypothetical protein